MYTELQFPPLMRAALFLPSTNLSKSPRSRFPPDPINPISSRLQASSRPSQLEQNRFPPLSILVVAKKFDRRNLLCTGCWKVFWLFLIFSINQTITQRNNPRYNDETFHDFTRRWGEMMWPMMIVPLHVLTRILIIVHKLMDKADDRSFHRYFCTAKFLWRYF